MEQYILKTNAHKNGAHYYESLTAWGFPYDVRDRKKAFRFATIETAIYYKNLFNSLVRACCKENNVEVKENYLYQLETIS